MIFYDIPLVVDLEVESDQVEFDLEIENDIFEFDLEADQTIVINKIGGDAYEGPYEVTPRAHNETILETRNKLMADNVTVLEIPYWETTNPDGKTVYIAGEVEINHGN